MTTTRGHPLLVRAVYPRQRAHLRPGRSSSRPPLRVRGGGSGLLLRGRLGCRRRRRSRSGGARARSRRARGHLRWTRAGAHVASEATRGPATHPRCRLASRDARRARAERPAGDRRPEVRRTTSALHRTGTPRRGVVPSVAVRVPASTPRRVRQMPARRRTVAHAVRGLRAPSFFVVLPSLPGGCGLVVPLPYRHPSGGCCMEIEQTMRCVGRSCEVRPNRVREYASWAGTRLGRNVPRKSGSAGRGDTTR